MEGREHAAGGLLPALAAKRTRARPRHRNPHPASANTASSSASSTEESADDEGMANCLILLAQGGRGGATPVAGKSAPSGLYVYECKTCNKRFPSFQALGGHRASHKKLKMAAEAAAATAAEDDKKGFLKEVHDHLRDKKTDAAGRLGKMHECSICGSEFSSGQALGGHMRRHRPAMEVLPEEELKKEKNVLTLDLNLPAPAEDDGGSFTVPGKPLVFSPAAALVDCHY